ncbi:hypothetical protein DP067_01105 [Mycoplasmopsis anatis]|uniref:Uncharacterized protein n=1 Tax=Mycoplasmopsis anatis 1340 TaxID=1034808 RepID=F9QEJ5_9BACT|nr:hypothetical protein [Mycoplasmopsis anatis]AWX69970.1 hypothetical protein DP067_01105 [Mycoplasmopsis anatis]EGS28845.1 hypothetical protein GIG_04074 [Mycoplasmopsis anatis 1340]VEU73600.1 Uncharacterised protein [Mycoplasmopsis anatis]
MSKNYFKKTIYRNTALIAGSILSAGILASAINYKISKKFKPSFYNYRASISKSNEEKIGQHFLYKQFNELTEFQNAILNNRAAAGIGTEYLATRLIIKGKISKIDYSKFLNLPNLKPQDYEEAIKVILKPSVFNHLKSYDKYLKYDENGNEINAHLWEYFFPYFVQDAIVAYNINKVNIADEYKKRDENGELVNEIDFAKILNSDNKDAFNMVDIMKTLRKVGYDKYIITDAIRDNMLYGSAYDTVLDKPESRTDENFTGEVTEQTYERLIKNFKDLIKDGSGFNINDTSHITFKGDGLEIVNTIVNPSDSTNVSIMYNGDGIDAYYSNDNAASTVDGETIRFVRPSKNVFLVDGVMFSASNSKENNENYMSYLTENVYQNVNLAYIEYLKLKKEYPNLPFKQLKNLAMIKGEEAVYKDWQTNKIAELIKSNSYFENNYLKVSNEIVELFNNEHFKLASKENKSTLDDFYVQVISNYFNEKLDSIIYDNSEEANNSWEKTLMFEILNKFSDELGYDQSIPLDKQYNSDFKSEWINKTASYLGFITITENEINSPEYNNFISDLISSKYLNLDNFDYVNYTTGVNLDMNIIYKNYFYNGDLTHDETVRKILWIDENDEIEYKGISPIEDYLNSKITFEYYKQTKS